MIGKVAEFQFQRRVSVVVNLKFLCDFAVKSFVAERYGAHNRISAGNDRAAKNFVRVEQIPALRRFGIGFFVRRGSFRFLLRFAVQNGLVNGNFSVDYNSVRRNFIAALQKDAVAHSYIVNRNFDDGSVAVNFAFNQGRFALQFLKSTFVFVLRESRNESREQNSHRDTDGLIPFRTPHERESHVQDEREN